MDVFDNPPFREPEFYRALGMKAGLEVHQQLLTARKLFCRCPAGRYDEEYNAEILRHMRPTLSELGEYDGTALMEYRTRKEIIYRLNNESVCTYEMDDSPPFQIDERAVEIALQIALLLECNIVGEIHIARKQYLDGSIPTGFQRTTVVGLDGRLPVGDKIVRVIQLGLEEDACREVEDVGHRRVYRTDRLGMALIEVVTAPELFTPREVYAAAQAVRTLTRGTGKVRTGAGAARQDVNVSIEGGTRVEIKGVSKIPRIPYLVHNEALRQRALLDIRDELVKRGGGQGAAEAVHKDVSHLLQRTDYEPIRDALARGEGVTAVLCRGFAGLLARKIQPGRPFVREFSDRVRVVACLDAVPNIACSDFAGENLEEEEWRSIMRELGAGADDAAILVWGKGKDLVTAVEELEGRAKEALDGVPSETRQALPDNTNGFERILPGPDRMYPDTDLPPRMVTEEELDAIKANTGMSAVRWAEACRGLRLPAHLAAALYRKGLAPLFLELVDEARVKPSFVASILVDRLGNRKVRGEWPGEEEVKSVFELLAGGKISKDAVKLWADGAIDFEKLSSSARDPRSGTAGAHGEELEKAAREVLHSTRPRHCSDVEAKLDYYTGKVKERLSGAVSGEQIRKVLATIGVD
jgi:glutamyl-tRNA(Gln) amidotransferase subunit E